MASLPALVLDLSIGGQRRIAAADTLYVGGGIDAPAAGALNIGVTNANAITIGQIGVVTTIAGDLQVDGAETVTGTTTFEGDTNIGDATTDTLTVQGDVSFTLPDDTAAAFLIQEAANAYLSIGTLNAGAAMAFGNAATNPTISLLGTGQKTINGNLDATSGIDVTGAVLSTAVGITNSAGEVLISGGNFQLNDTIIASFGTDDDLQIVHSGAAGAITNATGALKIENNAVASNIIVELGDNAAATSFVLNDSDSAALLTIDSNGQADFAGNVDANLGLDVSGGNLTATGGTFAFTGTDIDLDPTGTFDLAMDATKTATFHLADNLAAALSVVEAANSYFDIGTLDAGATMSLGNAVTNPTISLLGTGQKTVNGNLDATGGLDVTGGALTATGGAFTFTGTDIDLDPTGTFDLAMDATKTVTFHLADNLASALLVQEGANTYLDISTTDAGAAITLGNATTDPEINFPGDGEWNLAGSPGTAGYALVSNGAGAAPTWQAVAAGSAQQVTTENWDTDTNAVVVGEVAAYTSTADRAARANATSASGAQTCIGICSVRDATAGKIVRGGRYTTAKFIAALTLNNGNRVFVSKTAGSLTNDVSAFTAGDKVIPVGWVRDNGAYAGSGVADIELDFGEPVTL